VGEVRLTPNIGPFHAGLLRYTALLRRVGELPTYAMTEQVGAPQAVTLPTRYMELWVWEWRTAGSFGQVRFAFDHFNWRTPFGPRATAIRHG
jgi:hypothetical protein